MLGLCVGESAHAVLDDHHRTVNDDAEVQRAQAHEVGADPLVDHAGEGEQHGQRNDQRRDQCSAQISQEQKQNGNDENSPFNEVLLDRGNRLVDQGDAVVDRHRMDAGWQGPVDFLHALVYRLGHGSAVFPNEHEDRAQHNLSTVVGGRARAQLGAKTHLGNVLDSNRDAIGLFHHDVADVGHVPNLSRCPNQILLPLSFDVAGTQVDVVALQGLHDVRQGQAQ